MENDDEVAGVLEGVKTRVDEFATLWPMRDAILQAIQEGYTLRTLWEVLCEAPDERRIDMPFEDFWRCCRFLGLLPSLAMVRNTVSLCLSLGWSLEETWVRHQQQGQIGMSLEALIAWCAEEGLTEMLGLAKVRPEGHDKWLN